jgi:redox-sensing transcriptional repressor
LAVVIYNDYVKILTTGAGGRVMTNRVKRLSRACVLRLELYLDFLEQFQKEGKQNVTSSEIGRALGIAPGNVRQDLFGLGSQGRPKVGYEIVHLISLIRQLFDLDREKRTCIVGFGNLGRALAGSNMWVRGGYKLVAIFDNDPQVVGMDFHGLRVRSIAEIFGVIRSEGIEMAVITAPAVAAQEIANIVSTAGVRAIWNFAPIKLITSDQVAVENQSLAWGLITLSHKTKRD